MRFFQLSIMVDANPIDQPHPVVQLQLPINPVVQQNPVNPIVHPHPINPVAHQHPLMLPNPSDDSNSPYFLHPADVSIRSTNDLFNGENYVSRSHKILINLRVKNKLMFVNGALSLTSILILFTVILGIVQIILFCLG